MADELEPLGSISLLLADVDGTLVTEDKVLIERARAAVHRLHEAGSKALEEPTADEPALVVSIERPPRDRGCCVSRARPRDPSPHSDARIVPVV
jgi:hypothetical protein